MPLQRQLSVIVALRYAATAANAWPPPLPAPGRFASLWGRDWRLTLTKSDTLTHVIYLVDPASSHMLVSKLKPCMSKYRPNFNR